MYKRKGNHGSAAQMLPDKGVHGISVLESVEQRRQTFGLSVQREHHLVHQSKSTAARLSQHSSLGDPVPEKCQLHCLRPVRPEIVRNRIGVRLSSKKVRVHTPGFSRAVEAHVYRRKKKVKFDKIEQRSKDTENSHCRAFPKLSTSSSRNFSASAASDAFDRATSTLAVTTFS
jgi:hypothetical protein